MARERFTRAQNVLSHLQSHEDFEHFGKDSRGIRVSIDSFIEKVAYLASKELPPEVSVLLCDMGSLILAVSQDYGCYIRVKGGEGAVSVYIRGLAPLDESSTQNDLVQAAFRRSGVVLDIFPETDPDSIRVKTSFIQTGEEGENLDKVLNARLRSLTELEREYLIEALFSAIYQEIAEAGEFSDL